MMKIVVRNSDSVIVMVGDCEQTPTPSEDFTVHEVPGWDWSLVDLDGVDRSEYDWVETQMAWNGTTLVPIA